MLSGLTQEMTAMKRKLESSSYSETQNKESTSSISHTDSSNFISKDELDLGSDFNTQELNYNGKNLFCVFFLNVF